MNRILALLGSAALLLVLLVACSAPDDVPQARPPGVGFDFAGLRSAADEGVHPDRPFALIAHAEAGLASLALGIDGRGSVDLPPRARTETSLSELATELGGVALVDGGTYVLTATATDRAGRTAQAREEILLDASAPATGGDVTTPDGEDPDDGADPSGDDGDEDEDEDEDAATDVRLEVLRPHEGATIRGEATVEFEVATRGTDPDRIVVRANGTKLSGTLQSSDAGDEGAYRVKAYRLDWNSAELTDGTTTIEVELEVGTTPVRDDVTVETRNAPIVEWTSPTAHDYLAGVIRMKAEVRSPRTIDRWAYSVESEAGARTTIASGSGPFVPADWDARTVRPGTYMFHAQVVDDAGVETVESMTLDVDSVVTIASPTPATEIVGGEYTAVMTGLEGTLPQGVSVTAIDVLVNGVHDPARRTRNPETSTSGSVYVFPWDPALPSAGHDPLVGGERVLTVRAHFDDGTDAFSPGVLVEYVVPGAPEVRFDNPVDGTTVRGTIELVASATSGAGRTKVAYFANGESLRGSSLDTTRYPDDTELVLVAVVTDEKGQSGQAVVTVTVDNS